MSPPHRRDGIHLDPDWPGLEAPDGLLRADPDVIAEIGGRLRSQARSLDSDAGHLPSTVPYLDDYRRSTTAGLEHTTHVPDGDHWFGRWPTAGDMEHGWRTARWAILTYYKLLVEQLELAGLLLEDTAEAYRRGEAANQAELAAAARLQAGHTIRARTGTPVGRPADLIRESTQVPGISMCEAVDDYDPQWILDQIDHLRTRRPWIDMSAAASSLQATSERLDHLRDWLRRQATTLADAWSSSAATACQHALRRIAGAATHLADRSAQLAEFTARCADTVAAAVANFPALEGRSLSEWVLDTFTIGADPNLERKHDTVRHALARLNQDYTDINHTTLPTHIDVEITVPDSELDPDTLRPPERPVLPPPPVAGHEAVAPATGARDLTTGAVVDDATAGGVESHGAGASPAGMLGSTGGLASAAPTPTVGVQSPPMVGGGGAVPGTSGPPLGPGSGPAGGPVPGAVPGPGGIPAPRIPGSPGAGSAPTAAGGSSGARGTASTAGRMAGPGMVAAPMGPPGGQAGSPTRRSTGRAGLVGNPSTGAARRPGQGGTVEGADDWLVEDETPPWEGQQDTPPEVIK